MSFGQFGGAVFGDKRFGGDATAAVALDGTLPTVGVLHKTAAPALHGTLTSAGGLVRRMGYRAAGTLATAGTLVRALRRQFVGTLALSGQFRIPGAITATLTLARATALLTHDTVRGPLTAALRASGGLVVRITLGAVAPVPTLGLLVWRLSRGVLDRVVTDAALTTPTVATAALTDAQQPLGGLTRAPLVGVLVLRGDTMRGDLRRNV